MARIKRIVHTNVHQTNNFLTKSHFEEQIWRLVNTFNIVYPHDWYSITNYDINLHGGK